jgi:hypothetical protein
MAETVYILCALTSALCAVLLLRSYRRTGSRLLMWSTLAFIGLAINNVLLLVDLTMVPDLDLRLWRAGAGQVAMSLLVIGLILESK